MSDASAKKYDLSKKEEAFLYEMEVRQEKERLIREHEERRERYLKYLAERKEQHSLRWWQKAIIYSIAASFLFSIVLLLASYHSKGKHLVNEFLTFILKLT